MAVLDLGLRSIRPSLNLPLAAYGRPSRLRTSCKAPSIRNRARKQKPITAGTNHGVAKSMPNRSQHGCQAITITKVARHKNGP